MALDFSILTQAPTFGERFAAGRQAAQEEAQRNMLLQQRQMEFQQSQEDRRLAAEERQRKAAQLEADRGRRQTFLAGLQQQMAQNGYRLDRKTLADVLTEGMQTGESNLVQLATKGLQALDDEDAWRSAFGGGAPAGAAPAAKPAPAAPQLGAPLTDAEDISRANALGRTDPRFAMATPVGEYPAEPPAPVANAMVAPPADAERQRLNALLNNPSKAIRDEARERLKMMDAAVKAQPDILPKPEKMQLGDRVAFVDVNPRSPTFRQEILSQQVGVAPGDKTDELERQQRRRDSLPVGSRERAEVEARIKRLTEEQKGTTVKVELPPQPRKEQEARGTMLVEQYKTVSDAARLATRTLPTLETQERILDAGFRTGFGAEAQKAGASLLSALGMPEAKEYATNAQAFSAAMNQAVLQKQLEQKGVQTQADADRITQTGAQLTNTVDANRFIIAVARAQLKRDIAQRNFYDKWWKDNGTYDGAEDAWATGEGNKSLFESPELKRFAAPARQPAAATPGAAAVAPAGAGPYSDPDKERRYQEWKSKQGAR